MLNRLLPRFTQGMSPRAIIDALNQLVDALAKFTGIRPPVVPLGQNSDGQLYLDDTQYKRIPVRLTIINPVNGQLRYGFIQQVFDPTTGVYSDFESGLVGDGVVTYATELNNQNVGIDDLVWLRSKGIVNGSKVYEFHSEMPTAYVQPTTTSPTEILLGRTIGDAILDGTDVLISPDEADFTIEDEGAALIGSGIPGGTTILEVLDSNAVVMSAAATAGVDVTVEIVTGTKKGYAAVINYQDPVYGSWKRRTITDVTLVATSPTLTSDVQGLFTLGDDGANLAGSGIPANTTATLTDSTHLAMSNAATANKANSTVVITQGTLQACWFIEGNDSAWYPVSGSPPPPQPVSIPIRSDVNYQCRFFQNDASGVPIYEVVETPHAIIAQLNSGTPNADGLYDGAQDLYDPATMGHSAGIVVWLRDANA